MTYKSIFVEPEKLTDKLTEIEAAHSIHLVGIYPVIETIGSGAIRTRHQVVYKTNLISDSIGGKE